jgi:hypothetical protein
LLRHPRGRSFVAACKSRPSGSAQVRYQPECPWSSSTAVRQELPHPGVDCSGHGSLAAKALDRTFPALPVPREAGPKDPSRKNRAGRTRTMPRPAQGL